MAIVMCRIVGDVHMGEADETDDEKAEKGRKAKLENTRSR